MRQNCYLYMWHSKMFRSLILSSSYSRLLSTVYCKTMSITSWNVIIHCCLSQASYDVVQVTLACMYLIERARHDMPLSLHEVGEGVTRTLRFLFIISGCTGWPRTLCSTYRQRNHGDSHNHCDIAVGDKIRRLSLVVCYSLYRYRGC